MAIINIAETGGLQLKNKQVGVYNISIDLDNLDNLQVRVEARDKAKLQSIKGFIIGDYFFTKNELNFSQSGNIANGEFVEYTLGRSGLRARMNELDNYDIDVIGEFGVKEGMDGDNEYKLINDTLSFENTPQGDYNGEYDVYVGQYPSIDALPNDLKQAILQIATNLFENRNGGDGKRNDIYTADIKNTLSRYIVRGC